MKHSRENQSLGNLKGQSVSNKRDAASEGESSKGEGGFIGRWARRKHDTAIDAQDPATDDVFSDPLSEVPEHALQPEESAADKSKLIEEPEPAPVLTDEDMPDIETLNADSDFSPFFSKGVSKDLRNLALKKLFYSGKFSVRDGLDDYDDDFTKFEPLGDTVTCDMKFHARRKEKARLAALEEERLKLEAAQVESKKAEGELAEDKQVEGIEESPKEELPKEEISEMETLEEETGLASVESSLQDEISSDELPHASSDSINTEISDESVTKAALLKDKEPHV